VGEGRSKRIVNRGEKKNYNKRLTQLKIEALGVRSVTFAERGK